MNRCQDTRLNSSSDTRGRECIVTSAIIALYTFRRENLFGKILQFKPAATKEVRHEKMLSLLAVLATVSLMSPSYAATGPIFTAAEQIESSFIAKEPYPLPSQEIPGLTIDTAYDIKAEFVKMREQRGEDVMGYKAGFTSADAQKKFGVPEPAWGTLFKSMFRWPGTLYQKDFGQMFIETEIGFRFGNDIIEPVKDSETLKAAVAIVFPAIELPDIHYANLKMVKGTDIIAANVLVRKVLVGKACPVGVHDLDTVTVRLFHNGTEVTCGVVKNALGSQWEALKWTVNDVIERGGMIGNGDVIITGAISKLLPAKPGRYVADYGEFGTIEFVYR